MNDHPLRIGVELSNPLPGRTWSDTVRMAEDLGYSSLLVPDHFEDQLAPFTALAVAAAVSSNLRLGALVFGNDYRHPVVVAKEMATLDVLSGGRVEIGMGAGWMRTDYEQAGLDYDRPGVRIDRLQESIEIIRGLHGPDPVTFDGDHYRLDGLDGLPKPVQSPPKLIIGGGAKRMLSYAARTADIVGVTASLAAGEISAEAVVDSMGDAYDRKLEWIRDAAGDRFGQLELSSLAMVTTVTDDGETAREATAALFGISPEELGQSPAALVGSPAELADTLRQRRERWGINYPVIQGESLEAFAPVVAELSGT